MSDEQLLKFYEKISEMSERIARMETMLLDRENESRRLETILRTHDDRISILEKNGAKFFGVKEIVAWSIATGIGLMGVLK